MGVRQSSLKATIADGVIPKKYKELMAIAVAMTTQCVYCIEIHKQAAKKAGASEQEIAETITLLPPSGLVVRSRTAFTCSMNNPDSK